MKMMAKYFVFMFLIAIEEESKYSLKQTKSSTTGTSFIDSLQPNVKTQKRKKKKKKNSGGVTPTATTETVSETENKVLKEQEGEKAIKSTDVKHDNKNISINTIKNTEFEDKNLKPENPESNDGILKRTVKIKYVTNSNGTLIKKTKTRSRQKNIRKDTRQKQAATAEDITNETVATNIEEQSDFVSNWNE
jgi:lipopolysaccharide export LptBFGC system permease protein LptF